MKDAKQVNWVIDISSLETDIYVLRQKERPSPWQVCVSLDDQQLLFGVRQKYQKILMAPADWHTYWLAKQLGLAK
jgi:hypothetical protein